MHRIREAIFRESALYLTYVRNAGVAFEMPAVSWERIRFLHTLGVHVHFDANFKMHLVQWKGYTTKYPAPPNRRGFLDNARTSSFIAEESTRRKLPKSTCSDFVGDRHEAGDKRRVGVALPIAMTTHLIALTFGALVVGQLVFP